MENRQSTEPPQGKKGIKRLLVTLIIGIFMLYGVYELGKNYATKSEPKAFQSNKEGTWINGKMYQDIEVKNMAKKSQISNEMYVGEVLYEEVLSTYKPKGDIRAILKAEVESAGQTLDDVTKEEYDAMYAQVKKDLQAYELHKELMGVGEQEIKEAYAKNSYLITFSNINYERKLWKNNKKQFTKVQNDLIKANNKKTYDTLAEYVTRKQLGEITTYSEYEQTLPPELAGLQKNKVRIIDLGEEIGVVAMYKYESKDKQIYDKFKMDYMNNLVQDKYHQGLADLFEGLMKAEATKNKYKFSTYVMKNIRTEEAEVERYDAEMQKSYEQSKKEEAEANK